MRFVVRSAPVRIALIYVAVGLAYILLSDWLAEAGGLAAWRPGVQTLKGAAFVLVTAGLLYLLLRREFARREAVEAAARRAHKMEAVGQLASGVAHDFNNMLTVILGNLDLLEQSANGLDAREARMLAAARHATLRCGDLTRRLLGFARRQILEEEVLDLNEAVGRTEELLRRTLPEAIELEFRLQEGLAPIRADAGQLENAVLNLAINARDAMRKGGRLVIETGTALGAVGGNGAAAPDRHVYIAVRDTGDGIPEEHRARLFEPFFTTKQEGQGTGLGLAMVHGFVKQSGGQVDVVSAVGQGTTVTLRFPASAATPATVRPPAAVDLPGGSECVLVVENDEDILDIACRVLRDRGYRVLAARNATEALTAAREQRVDLLFADVVMPPPMDGISLAQALMAQRPDLKVLVTSGFGQAALRRDGVAPGDFKWLAKPYDGARLAQKVHATLGR